MNARKLLPLFGLTLMASCSFAQIPDLMTALDAGGRAMGLGGATYVTDSNTFSALANPAGLGYISQAQYGVAYRNLPQSRSVVTGDFNDPDFSTELESGGFGMSHVGYAFPMGRGALGVTYTRSGFFRDERSGNGLSDGALTVVNYEEVFRSQTDLFTISYGSTSTGGGANYGLGVVIANQYILNRQNYDLFNGSTQVGSVSADNSGTGLGFGVVAGMMVSVGPTASFGVSAQSPIDLSGNDETNAYYDRIPGRVSAGFATRNDRVNGEYTLFGIQASHYFGGQSNAIFPRENYTVFNAGFEHGFNRWNARIPLRFGYTVVPAGGDGFRARDAFTFGLGYRPNGSDFGMDLSMAKPVDGGALDVALSINYLLGKK